LFAAQFEIESETAHSECHCHASVRHEHKLTCSVDFTLIPFGKQLVLQTV